MILDPKRLKESEELLRKHLVRFADDGDDDSLFVRFLEILNEIDRLEDNDASWHRLWDTVTKSELSYLNRLLKAIKDERESRELADDPGGENEDCIWRRNNDQLNAVIKEIEEHQKKLKDMNIKYEIEQ